MNQVSTTLSEDEVIAKIAHVFEAFAGNGAFGEDTQAVQETYCSLGNALLERIHEAFIQKSQGTTGDDGITWKPLSQVTLRKRAKKKSGAPNLKDTAEYEKWRKVFTSTKYKLIARGLDAKGAEKEAAKAAWADLKADGYEPMLPDSSAFRILVENGDLLDSLKPSAVETAPPQNPQTVFEIAPGKMTVGTKEKPYHHKTRAFWPEQLPRHWVEEILHNVSITIVHEILGVMKS